MSDFNHIPSNFNDVVGLVIPGPSSSHSAAANRIGCLCRDLVDGDLRKAVIVYDTDGSLDLQLTAASVALQNSFGMNCDRVANRVEAPCLGKNILAGSNVVSCANMALADYEHLFPLDEVIYAMNEVADAIPHELYCTAKGGLSVTPTSKAIEDRLAENN